MLLITILIIITRNSSVDEISERYHLKHSTIAKLYHRYTLVPHNVHLSHWRIATLSVHRVFLFIAPYKNSYSYLITYLLTNSFLVDTYLWRLGGCSRSLKLVENELIDR